MANKAISELPEALNVNNQDLFVLEQGGLAKKLAAETFITEQGIIDALAEALDGHGGIQSVTLASVSGRVRTYRITFTDGSATTFQVLDGTTIERIAKTSEAGLVSTYTIFMSDGTTSFFNVSNGADGDVSEATLNSELAKKAPVIVETVSSTAIATFSDGADDMPMQSVLVDIEPVQDLSNGDPSPTNICPISGHTQATVTRTGKNLVALNASPVRAQTLSSVTVSEQTEQKVTLESSSATYACLHLYYHLKAGTYTVSVSATASDSYEPDIAIYRYSSPYTLLVRGINSATPKSFTISEDLDVDIRLFATGGTAAVRTVTFSNFQIEVGSTATTYEPYQSNTVTVDWASEASTVYGGTIDVATGLLTVDRAYGQVTADYLSGLSSSYIGYLSSTAIFSDSPCIWVRNLFYYNGAKSRTAGGIKATCNAFEISFNNTNFHASQNRCAFKVDGTTINSVESFISSVQNLESNGSGLFIAYELATPQTYQLTPQEVIKTLLGANNVWADIGNVSVTYPIDTKMYIELAQLLQDNNLAYVESSSSASRTYAVNDLFINRDGLLCKVTATISSGGTLVEGTNYTILSGNGGLGAEVTSVLNGKEDVGWLTGMGFSRTDVSGGGNVSIRDYTIFLAKLISVSGSTIQSLVNAHYKVTFYLKNSNGGSFSLSGNCAGNTYNLSSDSSGLVSGTYEGDVSANGTIYNGVVGGSVGSGSIFAATVLVKF